MLTRFSLSTDRFVKRPHTMQDPRSDTCIDKRRHSRDTEPRALPVLGWWKASWSPWSGSRAAIEMYSALCAAKQYTFGTYNASWTTVMKRRARADEKTGADRSTYLTAPDQHSSVRHSMYGDRIPMAIICMWRPWRLRDRTPVAAGSASMSWAA